LERQRRTFFAPLAAEFLGTFALIFAGPGAAAVDAASGGDVGQVGIGLSFGLVVMAVIFALGPISGAHINPAVSLAFFVQRRIDFSRLIGFISVQLTGAAVAGLAIVAIVGDEGNAGATVPSIGGADGAFISELILTFFLVLIVLLVATGSKEVGVMAAIPIGGFVGMAATGWGAVAGASMNPARSFGPALASNTWESHWVYWVAPLAAALLAAGTHYALEGRNE
jgi:aquaporin Z